MILLAMDETKLRKLIKKMQAGELSRNKNYDAYGDPAVRQAKRRQLRLESLAKTLADPNICEISLVPDKTEPKLWRLKCRSEAYELTWTATLREFEIDLLIEHPLARRRLEPHVPDRRAALFAS